MIHSDQGQNFENVLLRQTLNAFGIEKSRTTAYHPQGDEMVERLNRLFLQMLRAYVQKQHDWECHLSLVLFPYRTTVHSSTGMSPFGLMLEEHLKPIACNRKQRLSLNPIKLILNTSWQRLKTS